MTVTLAQAWASLGSEARHECGYVRIRVHENSACPIYAALQNATRQPAILFEVQTANLPPVGAYPSGLGFAVHGEPVVPGVSGVTRVVVQLTNQKYRDVFTALADDLLGEAADASSAAEGVQRVVARLAHWQACLRRYSPDGLSENEQLGLFAELWFLRSLVMDVLPPARAIASWTGPSRSEQDFQTDGACVEVKATRSAPHQRIQVSSVFQLDPPAEQRLLLLHLAIDARRGQQQTLPRLVAEIAEGLSARDTISAEIFASKLAECGYLDSQASLYEDTTYEVRNASYYEVREGFPRIRAREVPDGVGDVRFSVAVAACKDFVVSEQEVRQLFTGNHE